jgi:hypothetical protein
MKHFLTHTTAQNGSEGIIDTVASVCCFLTFFIILLSVFSIGCNKNPQGRIEISGTVTLDGVPIKDGSIGFEPTGSQTLKVKSGAHIADGKYKMPVASSLVPGEYSVRISASQETGKIIETPMGPIAEMVDIVPSEFGSESTQMITVTEKGKQIFDFDMKSK